MKLNLKYETLTDKELIERIKDCDMQAFDAIYYRYHRPMYVYAVKLIKNEDDAADIIQEIFIKIWEFSEMMPGKLNFRNYLYSMVRNRVFNYIRNNRARLINNYRIVCQNGVTVENEVLKQNDEKLLRQQLDNAIDLLPPQQKKVAESRRKGLSNKEIAENMNLSLNTVNIHYRLSLKALKKKLTQTTLLLLIISWIW